MSSGRNTNLSQDSGIKRTKQACTNCRRKKARCSGDRPACGFCARLSQPCSYEPYSMFQKDLSTSYTSILAADSQEMNRLQSRVASLEAKLAQVRRSPCSEGYWDSPSSYGATATDRFPPSATGDPTRGGIGLSVPGNTSTASELPDTVILGLADSYFQFCHNQPYSFFHEATFRNILSNRRISTYLFLAFAATALRFSNDPYFESGINDVAHRYASFAWRSLLNN